MPTAEGCKGRRTRLWERVRQTPGGEAVRAILISDTLHLKVRPVAVVVSVVALTTITGLSALLPAIRASLLRPITAMGMAE